MPIPQVKQQKTTGGSLLLNRKESAFDEGLSGAREGVLAMLSLGEGAVQTDGVRADFHKNESLLPEEYRIRAAESGIIVEAGDIAGAVHAAATLAQLCAENGGTLPFCEIIDAPEHPWRGFLVDVCRHFFPMSTLKTIVDLLAYYKYNRLHLHLTEDQGFRVESERFPLLNSVGSYRKSTVNKHADFKGQDGVPHGGYYTKAELRELVRYSSARGVEIVPEIDMPGHALSIIAAYPDLACFPEKVEVATYFGVTDFSKKLFCAGNEESFTFLFALIDEVLEIFPFPYVHIGGDEAVKSEWKRCKRCQQTMLDLNLRDERELQGYFLNRVIAHLSLRGRQAIVWNDGLCDVLDSRTVVQHWTPWYLEGPGRTVSRINAGRSAILSPFMHLYYDYPYAMTPLKKTYRYVPTLRGVRKSGQSNILGVEAAIWTEWIDTEEKLFFNTLPRLAATAETGWTPRARRDYCAFLPRLQPHYALYERMGLTYAGDVEQQLPLPRRIQGVVTYATKETHAELIAQTARERAAKKQEEST